MRIFLSLNDLTKKADWAQNGETYMKSLIFTLVIALGASLVLTSVAEANCDRASSAECSYQRQSESAKRAYGNGR